MNKTFVTALSALSLLIVTAGIMMWSEPDTAVGKTDSAEHTGTTAGTGVRFPWDTPGNASAPTATLAQLSAQPGGALQISAQTREVLDLFLSEHPPATPDVIAAQFKEAARVHLSEPALSEAADLMTRYAAYKDALKVIQSQPMPAPNVEPGLAAVMQLQQTSALREQFLGSKFKEGLYGQEEQLQRYVLARQHLMSVQGWTEQQRNEELAALEREYPRAVIDAAGRSAR